MGLLGYSFSTDVLEESEIVENIMAVIEGASEKVPKKWKNIQALHIKTPDSVALPIYNKLEEAEAAEEAGDDSNGRHNDKKRKKKDASTKRRRNQK